MKRVIIYLTIVLTLTSCCTKVECSSTHAPFPIKFENIKLPLTIKDFHDGKEGATIGSFQAGIDTTLFFKFSKDLSEKRGFKITLGDSVITLDDFKVEVVGTKTIKCNKCFLANGDEVVDVLKVTEFRKNDEVVKQDFYSIDF